MQRKAVINTLTVFAAALTLVSVSRAVTVPFTETFATDNANWTDVTGINPITFVPSDGADGVGDGYITATFNFKDSTVGDFGGLLARANGADSASGGAFVGDWVAADVNEFSFMVRHNAPADISFFGRIAPPGNFPAAIAIPFATVPAGQWTPLTVPIFDGSPNLVLEGSTFADIFADIGRLQLGVSTPDALAGVDQDFSFDLDSPSIVPEPLSAAGLSLLTLLVLRRRGGW